jgi:S1-C subfamily serine protease
MPGEYFCKVNGQSIGPVSAKHLRYLALYGKLSPDDLVRKEGSGEWLKAGSIATLFPADRPSETPPSPAAPAPPEASPQPDPKSSPASPWAAWHQGDAPVIPHCAASRQREKHLSYSLYFIIGTVGLGVILGLVLLGMVLIHSRSQEAVAENDPREKEAEKLSEPIAIPALPASRAPMQKQPSDPPPLKSGPIAEKKTDPPAPLAKPPEKVRPTPEVKEVKPLTREEIFSRCAPSVALVRGRVSTGTGFVVGPGLLATNAHVIGDEWEEDLKVYFPSASVKEKGPLPAKLVWVARKRDLAFLAVKSAQRPLEVTKEYRFRPAQDVLVIGNPGLGADLVLENAVCAGVMSTRTRLDSLDFYQLNIAINPGNSGGPVLDAGAQVIGVVAAKANQKEAIGFCIPVEDLRAGMTRAAKQSEADRERVASRHRLEVVFFALLRGGLYYLDAADQYAVAMRERKLAERQAEWKPRLQVVHGYLFAGFDRQREAVAVDELVAESVRDNLEALHKNWLAVKAHVEDARLSFAAYRDKTRALRKKHAELMEAIWKELALPNNFTLDLPVGWAVRIEVK